MRNERPDSVPKGAARQLLTIVSKVVPFVVVAFLLAPLVIYSGPNPSGWRWEGNSVTYNKYVPSDWGPAVDAAAQAWNNAGANFKFKSGGGSNKIASGTQGFPAYTWLTYGGGGYITECQSFFSPNADWSYSGNPGSSEYDVQNAMTHEFGHWLELLEEHWNSEETMYYYVAPEETKKRSLHSNDIQGIRDIYGTGGGGCSSAQSLLAGSTLNREELEVVERFGEAVLAENSVVRRYVEVLEGSREISILTSDPAIRHHAGVVIKRLLPDMQRALRKGSGMAMLLRKESVLDVDALLEHASQEASPALRNQITYVREMLRAGVGRTLGEVLPNGEPPPSVRAKKASLQNWPNPFNAETTIWFRVPETGMVRLVVHNPLGQTVRTLVEEPMRAGVHSIRWDGRDDGGRAVAGGIYFYRLETEGFTQTKKMLLLR